MADAGPHMPQPWPGSALTRVSTFSGAAGHLPASLCCQKQITRAPPAEDQAHPNLKAVSVFWGKGGHCSPSGRADLPFGGPGDIDCTGKGSQPELKVWATGWRMTRNHSLGGKREEWVTEPVEGQLQEIGLDSSTQTDAVKGQEQSAPCST